MRKGSNSLTYPQATSLNTVEIWIDSETWNRKRDQKLLALSLPKGAQAFEITSLRYRKLRKNKAQARVCLPKNSSTTGKPKCTLGLFTQQKNWRLQKFLRMKTAQMWNKLEIQIDCSEWAVSSQNVCINPCWGSPCMYHLLTNLKGKAQVLAASGY